MPVYRLDRRALDFPPAEEAEPDGLLAVGGDLRPERLLNAYRNGVFPWFSHRGAPYWFSPDPRSVLFPESFRPSRSLRRTISSGRFTVTFDEDFDAVIRAAALTPRSHEDGTWITTDFIAGYSALHRAGVAHSVEARFEGRLAGGLYGVALGGVFFGESMFHLQPDASKVAFAGLIERLVADGFELVDCQSKTPHLSSLGAVDIPRKEFLERLRAGLLLRGAPGPWSRPS